MGLPLKIVKNPQAVRRSTTKNVSEVKITDWEPCKSEIV